MHQIQNTGLSQIKVYTPEWVSFNPAGRYVRLSYTDSPAQGNTHLLVKWIKQIKLGQFRQLMMAYSTIL